MSEKSIELYRPIRFIRKYLTTKHTITIWHLGFPDPNGTFKITLKLGEKTIGIQEMYNWLSSVNYCRIFVNWGLPVENFDVQGSSTYSTEKLRKLLSVVPEQSNQAKGEGK